jgi:tetratricopeptide (TPR) repeat protein
MLFAVSLMLTSNVVRAQEPTEEEYKALQDIQSENDAARKTDLIVKFLKDKPKSSYRPNIVNEFQRVIVSLQQEKKWSQIITLGERYLDVASDDSITVSAMAVAYSETGNTKGFAAFGEKAYASKPSSELAAAIARAYMSLGNTAKFLQWGERTLASDPDNILVLSDMMRFSSQNLAQAVKYAKMSLKALPTAKKPASMDEAGWKTLVSNTYAASYAALGAQAFQNKNYPEAIKNLDSAVKYFKRNDSAYYWLGMSYWQQNKLDAAMLNFAKAYLIKGSTSSAAKKYLDQLYASSHRGSLAGVERVIERAQQDLK